MIDLVTTFIFLSFHPQMRSSIKTAGFFGLFPALTIPATGAEVS
jgi:hypothetical protein